MTNDSVCGNKLIVLTQSGLELPSPTCSLPKDHAGPHQSLTGAVWQNRHRFVRELEERFK